MEEKLYKICICPVKNEAWILEKFIKVTSLWADYIILANQNSTDSTLEIAYKFSNVIVVNNPGNYNEFERTKLLVEEARKIGKRRLILALDADEFLSANFLESPEWDTLLNMPTGHLALIERVNISPGTINISYFNPLQMIVGLMDDSLAKIENTSQSNIHNIRIPWPVGAKVWNFREIKILHFDLIDYSRAKSKSRWYQCFEYLNNNLNPIEVRDKYSINEKQIDFLKANNTFPIKNEWIAGYSKLKIDITSNLILGSYWWDEEVFELIEQYGARKFKYLNLEEVNWVQKAREKGRTDLNKYQTNRTFFEKVIYYLLHRKKRLSKTNIGQYLLIKLMSII